jgi:hypothetical protein
MGYISSPSHVQKTMDKVLYKHRAYAKCYIDDIVMFSATFEEHLLHIHSVLSALANIGLTLNPDKCHVAHHSVKLLGHVVDRFSLSTMQEKTDAIANLNFPTTLRELEFFCDLSGFYRHFVARYAALCEPLQKLKTQLLKGCPREKKWRDAFSRSTKIITPTEIELTSFQLIKDAMCVGMILVHHNYNLPLIYHIDTSVEGGFAVAIHQIPQDVMDKHKLTIEHILNAHYDRKLERPITYLSRLLNKHEVNYWPTELEIAGIVWALQKTKHLVEGCVAVKIYTDHKAAEDILTMKTLKTSSSVRQNLRLTRASQFLSQYQNIKVIYRPGKDHVNADALSRLVQLRKNPPTEDHDGVYGFVTTVMGLSVSALRQLEQGYKDDRHFSLIHDALCNKLDLKHDTLKEQIPDDTILPYHAFEKVDKLALEDVHYAGFQARICYGHALLYIKDPIDQHPSLCIPTNSHEIFFRSAHDDANHAGFERAYKRLRPNYYLKNLSASLRMYIASCPSCQRNSPTRHKPYGHLQPIDIPESPFEMVTLDLVVKLPPSTSDNFDSFMSITDKLTKMVTLIAGREDWKVVDWANAFFKQYYRRWGVPQRIITDRGAIFLSEFWTVLFKIMRTTLLVTTSYHPQSDGQSERTNQTVEIALRHLVNASKTDWVDHLPEVEFTMNNSPNASTKRSPMEFLTGLNARCTLDAPRAPHSAADPWSETRDEIRKEARDALLFAQTKMSIYYDKKREDVTFKIGDLVYIKLAKFAQSGYTLPNDTSKKLSQQKVGPFKILQTVGRLAYKLDIPPTWKIHPVISIAHLERHHPDPYNRQLPPLPDIIHDTDDDSHEEWEVEEILRSRLRGKNKRKEWRIKWKGFGSEHNTWEPIEHLSNAADKIHKFE